MIGITIEDIQVGDTAEITRVAAGEDIAGFVDAVGDHNPIHSDCAYAAGTPFKERIAPGIWTAGLISAVIGTRLPGPGAIYLSQDLRFLKPVLFGDVIAAKVEVLELDREKNRVRLRTVCTNQRGRVVLTGEAVVMPPRTPVAYRERRAAPALWALWTFQPWAWAAQTAAVWSMLGLSAWSMLAPPPAGPPPAGTDDGILGSPRGLAPSRTT
jgi:3-hydroxybutyryl-CoA dehydratase